MSTELDMGQNVVVKSLGDCIGGGRGVFAKRDILPGEVVFEDIPIMTTLNCHGEPMHVQLARRILQCEDRSSLLTQIGCLYPQSLSELSSDMISKAHEKYGDTLAHLLSIQAPPSLDQDEVLCILLKVCFSAFCGGLYVRKAMLNHSCRPNCIAFQPGQRTSSDGRILNTASSEVAASARRRARAPKQRGAGGHRARARAGRDQGEGGARTRIGPW